MKPPFDQIRPATVIGGLAVTGVAVVAGLWAEGLSVLPPRKERDLKLPGDDLLANDKTLRIQSAITINAPREKVWPYLAQLGQRRAGFYAPSWLERLFTFHIYNVETVVDEWQEMQAGEHIFYHQNGVGSTVVDVVPGEYFTTMSDSRKEPTFQGAIHWKPPFGLRHFAWTWNFILLDNGDGTTRFINRCNSSWEPRGTARSGLIALILGTPSVFMCSRMLKNVKKCAEGKGREPLVDRVLRFGAPVGTGRTAR